MPWFHFNSITALTHIEILTFLTMISEIFYRANSTLITAVSVKNVFELLFVLSVFVNHFTLILRSKLFSTEFYRWLTVFYMLTLMKFMWSWNSRIHFMFWNYHTFDTFKTIMWAFWAFHCHFIIIFHIEPKATLILLFWLHILKMKIVLIRANLCECNFRLIFSMCHSRWLWNILHTVVDFIQWWFFLNQFCLFKILAQIKINRLVKSITVQIYDWFSLKSPLLLLLLLKI